jgi:hypothetical protein
MQRALLVVQCAILVGVSTRAAAQDPTEPPTAPPPEASTLETPRGLAIGTGGRSTAVATSGVAYNAAGMAGADVYHIESIVGVHPQDNTWSLGAAAVDSVTSRLAAGFSFRYVLGGGRDAFNGLDTRLSLGMPLADVISIGVSARFLKLRADRQGDTTGISEYNVRAFTMDASIRLRPVEALSIVALGYNLVDTDSPLAPRQVGGGLGLHLGDEFVIAGDALVDLDTFEEPTVITGGGIEWLADGRIPLRLGYRWDQGRDLHSVTGGLGYVDQAFGADISLRQDVNEDRDTQLVLSFRYHVQ